MMTNTDHIIHNGQVTIQGAIHVPLEVYYEVMRVKNGVVMFREAHIARLLRSLSGTLKALGFGDASYRSAFEAQVHSDCEVLLKRLGVYEQNIKYSVYVDDGCLHRIVQYIPSAYPGIEVYTEGVLSKIRFFERENPNQKQMTHALSEIRQELASDDAYDYICMDANGRFLEGTKTNVFFVVGDMLYTAPDALVLSGITREVIVQALKDDPNFPLKLRLEALHRDQLDQVTGAFFTGTSIGVLPIAKIDDHVLGVAQHPGVQALMSEYRRREASYRTTKTETFA